MKFRIFIALFGILLTGGLVYGILQSNAVKSRNKPPDVFGVTAEQILVNCIADNTKKISERIEVCPVADKASFKGQEIAKIGAVTKVRRTDGFDGYVEITDTKEIPNGIEVLARAWDKNNVQIGFGKDGSVDIERFIIINPPILVDDPNGNIIRTWNDRDTGETKTRKLREDLPEALLQSLAHTIKVKQQKFGSENIVAGRIGNTILTAYPNAGTGTAPVDSYIDRSGVSESFATLRAGAGVNAYPTDADDNIAAVYSTVTTDLYASLVRSGFGFPTSIIGSGIVDSVIVSLWGLSKVTSLGDTDIDIVGFTPASQDTIVAADFSNFGSTRFATGVAISAAATGGYQDFTGNASFIAAVNGAGNTYIGTRLKFDIDNTAPTWASNTATRWATQLADYAGTTRDPKLVVEYTEAAAATPKRPAIIQWQ